MSNGVAGTLEIQLLANMAQLHEGMNKANKTVGDAAHSMNKALEGTGKALESLGLALGAREIAEFAKHMIDNADQMGKFAQKAGVAPEVLSRLSLAAKLSDVDTQTLAQAMGHLAQSAATASAGLGTQYQAFHALGISVTDAHGKLKGTDVLMRELAAKFSRLQDGTGKTAAAMAIFGRSGQDLIPMLNGGADDMDRLGKLADQLGITMSGNLTQGAQDVNDRMTLIGEVFHGITNLVLQRLLPAFDAVTKDFFSSAKGAEATRSVVDGLVVSFKLFLTVITAIKTAASELFQGLRTVADIVVAVMHGDFKAAADIAREHQQEMMSTLAAGGQTVEKIWTDTANTVEKKITELHKKQLQVTLSGPTDAAKAELLAKQLHAEQQYFDQLHAAMFKSQNDQAHADQMALKSQMANWQFKYNEAKKQHKLSLDEERQFQQAKSDIQQTYENQRLAQDGMVGQMILNLKRGQMQQGLESTFGYFAQLTSFSSSHSRRMFEINKAASTAQAVVHTYSAAVKAFDDAGGGPWGVAAAIASIAYGMAQVAAIQSTTFGGAGPAGGGGGVPSMQTSPGLPVATQNAPVGANSTVGQAAPQQTVINYTVQGASQNPDGAQLSYNSVLGLIDQINQAADNGHTIKVNATAA